MASAQAVAQLREPFEQTASLPVTGKSQGRVIELDILRGFLLLWMTLTHLPTKISIISNQTFGFVSGAEGFIFLAAFMLGQLEFRVEEKRGEFATVRDLWKRTFRIYLYHCLLLGIAFTLVAAIGVNFHRLTLENLLSFYLRSPKDAVIAGALLTYRPSLFDILPMYILFMGLTPLARKVARRWSWDPVIYTSFAIWAAAQLGLRHWLYANVDLPGFNVPEDSTGAFDMYAWQFLWMAGLALGSIYADSVAGQRTGKQPTIGISRRLQMWGLVVAIVFLVFRYSPVDHWIDPNLYGWLIDKWHLGPARIINFAAIAIVLVRFGPRIASSRFSRRLRRLARLLLKCFACTSCAALVALRSAERQIPISPGGSKCSCL